MCVAVDEVDGERVRRDKERRKKMEDRWKRIEGWPLANRTVELTKKNKQADLYSLQIAILPPFYQTVNLHPRTYYPPQQPKPLKRLAHPIFSLYVKARVLGHKRAKRNSRPNTTLVQIEGVENKEAAQFYLGKVGTWATGLVFGFAVQRGC